MREINFSGDRPDILPLTLEEHFDYLAQWNPAIKNLHSLWHLIRQDLEEKLLESRAVYVHYSLHDATHSRTVIQSIERFLGEDRIRKLSATDTFMILTCAYAHDYGMSLSLKQIDEVLSGDNFRKYLKEEVSASDSMSKEEARAVQNIVSYLDKNKADGNLHTFYGSLLQVIEMYLRPMHGKDVNKIWDDFKGLLQSRIKSRFVQGKEGIINICQSHSEDFECIFKMSNRADGIVGDEFHPRFIAAMIRLGDLLDLDNGRFPKWFVREASRNSSFIPKISMLNYKKHEAVSHLQITPKRVEISASCGGNDDGYEVACLISEWCDMLKEECENQTMRWAEIVQPDFGRPPKVEKVEITLGGKPYQGETHKLQMKMSQNRAMKLLEGTNLYRDQYVGIQELVQNAIDASLLQLWFDVIHNKYHKNGITKEGIKEGHALEGELSITEWTMQDYADIFSNYDIKIELIQDLVEQKVFVVVKDKGIGITPEDLKYISDIGASKEKNVRLQSIMKTMPRWLKPSGIFGIGLQSVFQLTDKIEFYSRRPNEPERMYVFHSYGGNYGRVENREIMQDPDYVFYDNVDHGTNVKIAIDSEKLLVDAKGNPEAAENHLLYYDLEFDRKDTLHAIYVELSKAIEAKIKEFQCDYFSIKLVTMIRTEVKKYENDKKPKLLRYSYFVPLSSHIKSDSVSDLPSSDNLLSDEIHISDSCREAFYYDQNTCRIIHVQVQPCIVKDDGKGTTTVHLPDWVPNPYHFQYKFNPISDSTAVFRHAPRNMTQKRAGFLIWNINIMDDHPEQYLNLNRDRLREGAVLEDELLRIRETIMQRWCEYLISLEELHKNPLNIIERGTILSLSILFYRLLPETQFQKFIEHYGDTLLNINEKLTGEEISVSELLDKHKLFYAESTYPQSWDTTQFGEQNQSPESGLGDEIAGTLLHAKTLQRLPNRLIHIYKIRFDDSSKLRYYFRLHSPSGYPEGIDMDDAVRLYDYCCALEVYDNTSKRPNFSTLIRKVFKPDQDFPDLLVSKYPASFRQGNNFSNTAENNIQWFILSPFDRSLSDLLKKYYYEGNADIGDKLNDAIRKNEQVENCVQYVLHQKASGLERDSKENRVRLENAIRQDYQRLIEKIFYLFHNHSALIDKYYRTRSK